MIVDAFAVASRGRNPDNPSDRTAGIETEQRLEMKEDGRTNTITSVQKDNYAVVKEKENDTVAYRIRKLTPTECFRLQGLTKEDTDKCVAVGISNTQLYRQAGNGIATECVKLLAEHLFKAQYNPDYVCSDELITAEKETPSACLRVGQASSDGSQAGMTFSPDGVFQTVCACTHGYAIGNIIVDDKKKVNGETISYCLDASYYKGGADSMIDYFANKKKRQLVCVPENE